MRDDRMVRVMYRIFDYLYESKEYAESLEDGKEVAKKVYCFIHTEDKDDKELDPQWAEIYYTRDEAETALKEWNEF